MTIYACHFCQVLKPSTFCVFLNKTQFLKLKFYHTKTIPSLQKLPKLSELLKLPQKEEESASI